MKISRSVNDRGHAMRLDVTSQAQGWEVRYQEDAKTIRDVVLSDWHRVERAISAFDLKAAALCQQVRDQAPVA